MTAQFNLESQFNAQSRVQRETLDTLKEGVAVFGTDGRLKLSNAAFATSSSACASWNASQSERGVGHRSTTAPTFSALMPLTHSSMRAHVSRTVVNPDLEFSVW